MPSESAYPSARRGGPYSAAPSQRGIIYPGALGTTTRAARVQTRRIPVGHEKVKAHFQGTKTKFKGSLGSGRHPRRPLEPAGAGVLSKTFGVQNTRAFPGWTSSFPPARAAGEYVWACLAEGCHALQQHLPLLVPPPWRWAMTFGSSAAARPLGCLQAGTVGWEER